MKLMTLALGAVLLALAAASSANAWIQPQWIVVRWVNGDCKIWHNDTNAPAGYGWTPVAFAQTYDIAWWKMNRLYAVRQCV
jgi:opacity protein-like surface antigen